MTASPADDAKGSARSLPPHILVVDDNLPVRTLLQRALARIGCRVSAEANGKDALRRARRDPPDLILMDMRLPGLDGPELLAKLRRTRGLERVPVVGISGYTHPQLKARALGSGCVAFLEKPLVLDEVRETVMRLLDYHPDLDAAAG